MSFAGLRLFARWDIALYNAMAVSCGVSAALRYKASVLREKDIMQEEQANTPARRIYFPVMMMYLDEPGAERYYDEFVRRMSEFMGVIRNPQVLADCVDVSKYCMEREYYKALMMCRKLIEYEDERLGNVPASVPASSDQG